MAYQPGHGRHPSTDPSWRPADPATPEQALWDGWRLFHDGAWWEAHEAWEAGWRMFPDRRGHAHAQSLQALIQLAAARLRARAGDAVSAERLREAARARLALAEAGALIGDPGWIGKTLANYSAMTT